MSHSDSTAVLVADQPASLSGLAALLIPIALVLLSILLFVVMRHQQMAAERPVMQQILLDDETPVQERGALLTYGLCREHLFTTPILCRQEAARHHPPESLDAIDRYLQMYDPLN